MRVVLHKFEPAVHTALFQCNGQTTVRGEEGKAQKPTWSHEPLPGIRCQLHHVHVYDLVSI